MNILALYDKLESFVLRLPAPLQSPILREISPIKTLFLKQRPPRLLLLGDRAASRTSFANALFGAPVARVEEDSVQIGAYQSFTQGRGRLLMLDGRRPAIPATLRRAIEAEPPDVAVFLHMEPRTPADLDADMLHAAELLKLVPSAEGQPKLPIIAVTVNDVSGAGPEAARRHMHDALSDTERNPLHSHLAGYFVISGGHSAESHALTRAIALDLPQEARVEMGRLSGVRELQRESAQVIIKSMAAICGAIGAQPIPLADFPILTSLQVSMVAGIMHISGRELSVKLAGEWLGALGANIGAGLVFREGARAALKFLPVWGDICSGGIAAAGTYAIGKAAVAYFIDGVTLPAAQKLFHRNKKAKAMLQNSQGAPAAAP